jgi:hypothetical protein
VSKKIIYQSGDDHRHENDAGHYRDVYAVHIAFKECIDTIRSVYQHKCEEEDRKDDHLDQLWDEMTESLRKGAHF